MARSLDNVALDLREALHKCCTLRKLYAQVPAKASIAPL